MKSKYLIMGLIIFVATNITAGDQEKLNEIFNKLPRDVAEKISKPTYECNKFSASVFDPITKKWKKVPFNQDFSKFVALLKGKVTVSITYGNDKDEIKSDVTVDAAKVGEMLMVADKGGRFMSNIADYRTKHPRFYGLYNTAGINVLFGLWVRACGYTPFPKNWYLPTYPQN